MQNCLRLLLPLILAIPLSAAQKINWEEIDWQLLKTEHFDIYFPKGYNHLAQKTMQYAEEANIHLSQKLNHRLSMVTPIFVYPSHGHFQSTNIIPFAIDEGTGGFTERIKRRVVVPYLGSGDDFRHVVVHELVHAFQYDILLGQTMGSTFSIAQGSQPPLWFVEGMAEYFSLGWDATADMQMRDAALTDSLPTLEMMNEYRVQTGFIFYKGGQSVMQYIAETYGENKLGEMLRDLRDLRGIEDAVKTNLGVTFDEFDDGWRRWVKRKYFHLVNKKYDTEEGPLISRHNDDESIINLHPSISPDGTKAVYLTARGFYPVLVMRDIKDFKTARDYSLQKKKDLGDTERILLKSSDNPTFFQLHLLTNRISFSPDSKQIFFSARSQGKDRLILFDIETRKIVKRLTPPVDMVMHPRLSPGGTHAVFVGVTLGVTDVYRINLTTGQTDKLTHDAFSEKDPALSGDGRLVVYSSNTNAASDIESADYHLYEMDIETKKIRQLTNDPQKQVSAQFYERNSNDKILYVSNHTGIHNIYLIDRKSLLKKKFTDTGGGALDAQVTYPAADGQKRIIYTQFRQQGFDIALREVTPGDEKFYDEDKTVHTYKAFSLPRYDTLGKPMNMEPYRGRVGPDFVFFLLGYGAYSGGSYFAGMVALTGSDLTGNHSFSMVANFLTNGLGIYQFDYGYLKQRVKMHWGGYRTTFAISPVNLIDLTSLNGLFYYPEYVGSVLKIGAYFGMEYPVTPFDSALLQFNIARAEETFLFDRSVPDTRLQPDRFTNMYTVQYGFRHNNVLYSVIGPLKGWSASYVGEQSINISGRDYMFNRNTVDGRFYWHIWQRYIFASRFYAATTNGPDAQYFPWIIGGPFNLRAYKFWSLRGQHAFYFNLEFRFPLLDALAFGLPVPWMMRGFSMVMFLDGGGVFDNPRQWRAFDASKNEFQDLLLSYGLGARFILFPGLMVKIDWGTPWTWKNSRPIGDWQGAFSIGYEY
jgi:Tol biopolymer transport system component